MFENISCFKSVLFTQNRRHFNVVWISDGCDPIIRLDTRMQCYSTCKASYWINTNMIHIRLLVPSLCCVQDCATVQFDGSSVWSWPIQYVVNRWKKKEAAGSNKTSHAIDQRYVDINLVNEAFMRYTEALWMRDHQETQLTSSTEDWSSGIRRRGGSALGCKLAR